MTINNSKVALIATSLLLSLSLVAAPGVKATKLSEHIREQKVAFENAKGKDKDRKEIIKEMISKSSFTEQSRMLDKVVGLKEEQQMKMIDKMIERAEAIEAKKDKQVVEILEAQLEVMSNPTGKGEIADTFKQFSETSVQTLKDKGITSEEVQLMVEFMRESNTELGTIADGAFQENAYKNVANGKFKDKKEQLMKIFEKLGLCKA